MSLTLIDTLVTNTLESLPASGDDLLVTNSGSIINSDGDNAIDAAGGPLDITIDGLVYAEGEIGVDIFSGANVFVGGQVQGSTGVWDNGSSAVSITVASQGSINGDTVGVSLWGNSETPAATSNSLTNAGEIFSGYEGVVVVYGGDDTISNSGLISGPQAVALSSNVATETVENAGTIKGSSSAINSVNSSAGVDIVNSGLITDDSANAIGGSSALLYFDDNRGTTSTIDNSGTISGSGYVIQSVADILDISNSGTIHGGLYSTAEVDVNNSGLWQVQAGTAVAAFDLVASDNAITNSQAGVIDGAISFIGAGDTLNNAGKIEGTVGITAGADTITNSGDIDGSITFYGTGATNTVTNNGEVTGDLLTSGASDTVTNKGAIYGSVRLTGSNVLTNTGLIQGDVTLSDNDTFNYGSGKITGVINASTIGGPGDLLEFAGDFGEVTVAHFLAGTGTSHDTIQFAANDFGTFAQVQAASTQVGADVVIKLDGTDSLTLTNVTLSSLVSADFKFV